MAPALSLKIGLGMPQYQVIYKYQKYLTCGTLVHAVTPYSYNDIGLYIFISIIIFEFNNNIFKYLTVDFRAPNKTLLCFILIKRKIFHANVKRYVLAI